MERAENSDLRGGYCNSHNRLHDCRLNTGFNDHPAKLITDQRDGAWSLWKTIAKDRPEFGNPSKFCGHIDESKWFSYTVTLRDPLLIKQDC
jgi:myosin-crossreactive antigen